MISIRGFRSGDIRTGVCYGDSGGPLLVNGVQIGTVQGGPAPCENGLANYANVQWSSNRDWILSTMNNNREVEMEFQEEDDVLFSDSPKGCLSSFEKESLSDFTNNLEDDMQLAHATMVSMAIDQPDNESLQQNVWIISELLMTEWSNMGLSDFLQPGCTSCADVYRAMTAAKHEFLLEISRLGIDWQTEFPMLVFFVEDLELAIQSVCM
jgi:hypothetical protein